MDLGHRSQVTAYDLVNRLLSYLGGNPDGPAHADLRRAILDAYREMPGLHAWTYFVQIGRVFLQPAYSTGTVEFDFTGGANERQLTLTGGVWPTWANRGAVRINSVTSFVDQRVSDTVLTLDSSQNPGADVEAGTAFELVQDSYQLPIDFTVGDRGLPETCWGGMQYVRPADWLASRRYFARTGTTWSYCVPDEDEILTQGGWKHHSQLAIGEMVMGYSLATGELRWTPLLDVATFDYDGDLLKVGNGKKGKQLERSILCTPHHRWPVHTRKGMHKMVNAEDLSGACRIPNKGHFVTNEESILTPRLAAILGWAVTDGSALLDRDDHNEARITQSAKKHLQEISEICGTKIGALSAVGVARVPIGISDRRVIRTIITKRVDLPKIVCQLSREAAEAMWDAMFKAEGSTEKHHGQMQFSQYVERNRPVMDAFQILCIMTGRASHINEADLDGEGKRRLTATILKSKYWWPTVSSKKGTFEKERYKGIVWCPQTEFGTWVMRHRGRMAITGNTFTSDPKAAGRLALRVDPAPLVASTLDFVYRRRCRDIKIWEQTKGKASVTAASNTVTLSQTGVFAPAHVGSVIRLSDGSVNPPTDLDGLYPYVVERTIMQVVSTTEALVDDAFDTTYANVAYRISDPIDVEPTGMYNALYTGALRWLCVGRNRKELQEATANWRFSLDLAKESDARSGAFEVAGGMAGYGWNAPLEFRGPITSG